MGDDEAEQVGEAVGDVTAEVVADAIEGAGARADAAQETAEAIADAAFATAQGQHIQQVERDAWREIALLHERVGALEAKHDVQQQELSSLRATQLSLSEEQTATLMGLILAPSTPPPPPTPPAREPNPPVDPAASEDAPDDAPAPARPSRRHRMI